MALRRLREHLAGGPRPREDAVLVIAADAPAAAAAAPVLAGLTDGRYRIATELVAGGGRPATPGEPPDVRVRHLPAAAGLAPGLALKALRVRAALVIGRERLPPRLAALAAGAVARGIPVYGTGTAGAGLDLRSLRPLSAQAPPCAAETDAAGLATLLARAVGVERDPAWSPDRLAARLAAAPARRLLAPVVRRIDSATELAAHLGHPRTILCLGNGPTSTDPALAGLGHDVLFRVNHDWRAGGYLSKPDMVFAGVKRSMRKLGRTTLGVATPRKEAALIACRAFEPWHGRATYAVVERIAAGVVPEAAGPERPTTGAYMLGAAVALAPERLIVAGIDMFRHPDGPYAGPSGTPGVEVNAYTPSHGYATDAAFITACLAQYRGELVVLSPALAELIRAMPGKPGFALREAVSR